MELDGIAFAAPAGLEDRTNYVHRAEGPREELAVELELPVGAATPAAEVLADQRESMEGFFDADFGVEDQGETTLAGHPAVYLRYFFYDGGERKYGETVVGNPGGGGEPSDYVRLNWKGKVDGSEVVARVDPIVRSFRAASDPVDDPGPGLRTRTAGPWAYALPERFSHPRTRIWTDGDRLRVQLSVLSGGSSGGASELEALVAQAIEPGRTLINRDDRPRDEGVVVHLHLRGSLDSEWSAVAALLRLGPDPRTVTIVASARWADDRRLESIVETLIASLAIAETRRG